MIIDSLEAIEDRLPQSDPVGDGLKTARIETHAAWKLTTAVFGTLALAFAGSTWQLANRPITYRYIRINSMETATPIQYSDLNYTPREGEVRNYLEAWARAKYGRLRGNVLATYKQNYYFEDKTLSRQDMAEESRTQAIARVAAGLDAEHNIEINGTQFVTLAKETVQKQVLAKGQAIIDFSKVFADDRTGSRREHCTVVVTFYLNPEEVSERSVKDPDLESVNPLGLFVTEHHETRLAR